MDLVTAMARLEEMGTEQNVKIYRRRGARDPLFGVSFKNLGILKKEIGKDHHLGIELWTTGNYDARILGTMIMDPKQISVNEAQKMVEQIEVYTIADNFSRTMSELSDVRDLMERWIEDDREFVQEVGYNLIAHLLISKKKSTPKPDLEDCKRYLELIEDRIDEAPNRARHSMNGALIAIGMFVDELTDEAKAAAKRIGKVVVDHGKTGCVTPEAVPYIEKGIARRR